MGFCGDHDDDDGDGGCIVAVHLSLYSAKCCVCDSSYATVKCSVAVSVKCMPRSFILCHL